MLEKMFGMPEIIEGNYFLKPRGRGYDKIAGTSFFGRDYSLLIPILDDIKVHSSIKSTILLLALQ